MRLVNPQMAGNNTFLNHYHFVDWLSVSDDIFIGQVDSCLDISHEVTDELTPSFVERLVEQVKKVCDEFAKKPSN